MEGYLTQSIKEYWLKIPTKYKGKLSKIRIWKELRIAIDGDEIWVRGILPGKLNSPEIRSIPFKEIYFQRENALFLFGNSLPERRMKTSLLWSPIHTVLTIEKPAYNFNYFGIQETVEIKIIPSIIEKEPIAMMIDKVVFNTYIQTAPAIRLKNLEWTILEDSVMVKGNPLLPIPGKTYWQQESFLLPTGYNFEFEKLDKYANNKIDSSRDNFIVFQKDNSYFKIPKDKFRALTISSYRLSK
ncbi:MAG: hypothetical protein JXR05_01995 [Flavobacteriaceae bacterium]